MPTDGPIPVWEAVAWEEKAPGGSSESQVFRLHDGSRAIVKFQDNPQGTWVLVNEHLCCSLAQRLGLPINRPRLVSVDDRHLRQPKADGHCPQAFAGGIHCGLIRYADAAPTTEADLPQQCDNAADIHGVVVFEKLVARGDSRQLLTYPVPGEGTGTKRRRFAAFDYGYAFGGSPGWMPNGIRAQPAPQLPTQDPITNQPYPDGSLLLPIVTALRSLTHGLIEEAVLEIYLPRWGFELTHGQAVVDTVYAHAQSLIDQYDAMYNPQREAFNDQPS